MIHQHDVTQRRPLLIGQLRRHPRPGVGLGQPPADQPVHPQFRVRPHPHHQVKRRGGGQRGEQRDVVDHHRIRRGACRWISANLDRTSGWVIPSRALRASGSAKTTDARAARSSAPSGPIIAAPKASARPRGRVSGRDDLPGQLVGVDHHRAAVAERAGDRGFARSDSRR